MNVEITDRHIGLARGVTVSFVNRNALFDIDQDDLYSAALESLVVSAIRYDKTRTRMTFRSYAAQRMWYALMDEVRVIVPGWRQRRIREQPLSIEVPLTAGGDEAPRLAGAIAGGLDPADTFETKDRVLRLVRAVNLLPVREREIIRRTLNGESQVQIGRDLRLSESRISQLRRRACDELREAA